MLKNKYNLKVGDMIIYDYLGTDYLKGRVLELHKDKVHIEVTVYKKKSEDPFVDNMKVPYELVYPFPIGLELKNKKKKKAKK